MALEFKKSVEAINFGGLVATPELDVEKRLRLQNVKLDTAAGVDEAILIIKECFGDKGEQVAEFVKKEMNVVDIIRLQAYLVGGDSLVKKIDKKASEGENE